MGFVVCFIRNKLGRGKFYRRHEREDRIKVVCLKDGRRVTVGQTTSL